MIDAVTLFLSNAIVVVVLAGVIAMAWIKQPEASWFGSWVADKLLLVTSMAFFALDPGGADPALAALSNMTLIAGFYFRWRAARQFNGRRAPWIVPGVLPLASAATRCWSPAIIPYSFVFCVTNAILAACLLATGWEFWRDRADGLMSRYGLAVANAVAGLIFLFRLLQGAAPGFEFESILTHDAMLKADLLVALVYSVANGAFSLSLAQERSLAALERAAFEDPLTGLPNRRSFERRFADANAPNASRGLALAMLDVDHFKAINDQHGHAAGDEALKACARVIAEATSRSSFAARIGGEEFVVLMSGVSKAEAHATAEALRSIIARTPVVIDRRLVGLTVSIGLHYVAGGFPSFDEAMRAADAKLYLAKATGRNRVEWAASA
jgi:diguanylate cyclase (GGDEF)-like protein